MPEQLGVDREDDQAAASALGGELAQACRDRGEELPRLAASRGLGDGRLVGPAADLPDPHPAQRFARELRVGGSEG